MSPLTAPRDDDSDYPRKRARLDDADYTTFTKHAEYYFQDWTICLAVERTIFRVYRGVLTRHSTVFEDMFSLSGSPSTSDEMFEGAPVILLTGAVRDFEIFLKLLYDVS